MTNAILLQVKEELGRGLTSIVHKCIDRFTGESYAVKILDLNQSSDMDILDAIKNEVKILSCLEHHPNIISAVKVNISSDYSKVYNTLLYTILKSIQHFILHHSQK